MHKNMPSCWRGHHQQRFVDPRVVDLSGLDLHTLQLAHPKAKRQQSSIILEATKKHTRVPCSAVRASVISGDRFDQLLERPLIARLMALA